MLVGERVLLRDWRRSDVEARHAAMAGDYAVHALTDYGAWRPESLERALARHDRRLAEPPDPTAVLFAVARRGSPDGCIGSASLWRIEEHQRTASLGIALAPDARGEGLGSDAVRLLCAYAFRLRDLHRLQVETLATNAGMLRAAHAAGFVEEGRLREAAYVLGERVDEVYLGLLRSEWSAGRMSSSAGRGPDDRVLPTP